ncbi:MAG TPA: hypothetical protein VMH80_07910 [Bryobacteraceae bacterium]|nr:hypothetical protein [Bryobacteraceae bacterium]
MPSLADLPSWLPTFALGLATFAVGLATTAGVFKFYLEPRQIAAVLQKKYGTALWIACKELYDHLSQIRFGIRNDELYNSLLKIPANDWAGRSDWFIKDGFYTVVTAHKIAVLSAWLFIYQQELLFSRTQESSRLLVDIYTHAAAVRKIFSEGSCLWPEYFDAIGSQCVEKFAEAFRPLPLSSFCLRYSEAGFIKFYDQLHNFIHLTVKEEREAGKECRLEKISNAIRDLMNMLEKRALLAGLQVDKITTSAGSR